MKSFSFFKELARYILLIGALLLWVNMGEGGKEPVSTSKTDEPHFAPLEESEGNYNGTIYDEKTTTKVHELSFFGHTKVGGLRKESDDSFNQLKLSDIKEIQVVNPNYLSNRFKDKDFALIKVITINGNEIPDLLAPRHIVICGIEQGTKIEKAWFLNAINKIVIISTDQTTQESKKNQEVKKEEPTIKKEIPEDKEEVKKKAQKIEKDAKEIIKNVKDIKAANLTLLPEERLPRTLWEAFIDILDAIINFFKFIIKKVLSIFGY